MTLYKILDTLQNTPQLCVGRITERKKGNY